MKFRLIRVVGLLILLAFIVGLLPSCQPTEAASSYVAVLPTVLHSGHTEAISLALFAGDKLVKDNVEVTLLKDGKKVASAKQVVDGKGHYLARYPESSRW